MYEGLKPCLHRHVDRSGRILCELMRGADSEVSLNLCRACPVPEIDCQHLRATMAKQVPSPITVRYATGRVEVWNNNPPSIGFKHAACAEKTIPIHSPHDCSGCPLRLPMAMQHEISRVARRPRSTDVPLVAAERASLPRTTSARETRPQRGQFEAVPVGAQSEASSRGENKSKIILLQQWLRDQFGKKDEPSKAVAAQPQPDAAGVSEIVYPSAGGVYQEEAPGLERCVGWTD